MIFPAHRVFVAARQLDLQIAVSEIGETDTRKMKLIPRRGDTAYRLQTQRPDIIAIPCTDLEYLDCEARTDDGALLISLLSEENKK